MAEDNVKAQMRKGILEYCILAILSREDSYAPKIIAELKQAEMIFGAYESSRERMARMQYSRIPLRICAFTLSSAMVLCV